MKKKILIQITILLLTGNLFAQNIDTLVTSDKSLSCGFIGMSPKGDSIFRAVEIVAEYPGGLKAWKEFLVNNINPSVGEHYIKIPKGEKTAKASITVTFEVNKEGNVENVKADSISEAMQPKELVMEAKRIINASPRWSPATICNKGVTFRASQMITFEARKKSFFGF